jgi:hypothetical protein
MYDELSGMFVVAYAKMPVVMSEIILTSFVIIASIIVVIFPLPYIIYAVVATCFLLFQLTDLATLKLATWLLWVIIPRYVTSNTGVDTTSRSEVDALLVPDSAIFIVMIIRDVLAIIIAISASLVRTDNNCLKILFITPLALIILSAALLARNQVLEIIHVICYLTVFRLIYMFSSYRRDNKPMMTAWISSAWLLFCNSWSIPFAIIPVCLCWYRQRAISDDIDTDEERVAPHQLFVHPVPDAHIQSHASNKIHASGRFPDLSGYDRLQSPTMVANNIFVMSPASVPSNINRDSSRLSVDVPLPIQSKPMCALPASTPVANQTSADGGNSSRQFRFDAASEEIIVAMLRKGQGQQEF